MSYIMKKGSTPSFGNAGVSMCNLDRLGYVTTLCTTCVKIGDADEKDIYVDLHLTKDQLLALSESVQKAIESYIC